MVQETNGDLYGTTFYGGTYNDGTVFGTSFRKNGTLYSLADVATLGFAISLMTSASVALADCFLVFFLPIASIMSRVLGSLPVNLDHVS